MRIPHSLKKTKTIYLPLLLGLILGGCVSQPFIDGRREAGKLNPVGPSTKNRVAICYNNKSTTSNEIWKIANKECAKTGRQPIYDGEDKLDCTLTNPTRVYFRCSAVQFK